MQLEKHTHLGTMRKYLGNCVFRTSIQIRITAKLLTATYERPASSEKSPLGSGEWIIPGFVLCRTAHFSLALSVLYQGIVSIGVIRLKDPPNLASFLSWQAATVHVIEECLHMSFPRNIFSILSDKAQSQMGRVVKGALDKELASGVLVSFHHEPSSVNLSQSFKVF